MASLLFNAVNEARLRFPAGLQQAPDSCRFGMDALLLAAFACHILKQQDSAATKDMKIAEIGCGCGAALLAFAMTVPDANCLGIDNAAELIACAQKNAELLGIEKSAFICANARNLTHEMALKGWLRGCSCVMANPPWRKAEDGQPAKARLRRSALVISENSRDYFCRGARELLHYHAWFCCILPPALLPDFCKAAAQYSLGLRLVMPVANIPGENATRLLLACRKEAAMLPEFAPPLILRAKTKEATAWSPEALQFCPWLASGRHRKQEWNS